MGKIDLSRSLVYDEVSEDDFNKGSTITTESDMGEIIFDQRYHHFQVIINHIGETEIKSAGLVERVEVLTDQDKRIVKGFTFTVIDFSFWKLENDKNGYFGEEDYLFGIFFDLLVTQFPYLLGH